MPAVTRDLKVSYGGFEIGGNTDRLIDSYTRLEDGYALASFEVSFIITAASDAAFASACAAAEAAFRKPRQDLIVTQGASTLKSLKQSDNTGLDCDPKILKQESLADTGRSRRYTVRFDFGRPADNVDSDGLRSSTTLVQYSESRRRRVTVAGVWTAIPPTGTALAQYLAEIDAWALTQLQVIDPNAQVTNFWELVDEPRVEYNTTNKVMEFSRTYQEKVYPDAGQNTTTMDDADLVNQQFKVGWVAEGNNDSPGQGVDHAAGAPGSSFSTGSGGVNTGVQVPNPSSTVATSSTTRMGRVLATYDAGVNKDRTIDLKSKYANVIRAWMITEAAKVFASGYGPMCLMNEHPEYDRDNNRIHVEMEFFVLGPAHIIEQKITTRESTPSYGWVLAPRWNGNPMSKYKYRGPMQKLRIISETRTVAGAPNGSDLGREPVDTGSSVPVSRDVDQTKRTMGVPGNQFDVTDIVIVTTIELYDGGSSPAAPPGPASGPAPVATPSPGTNFFPPSAQVVT